MSFMRTKDLLDVMKRRIFCCYDLSRSIISDREKQMTAKLWKRICERYRIKLKLSSAHHSETNDQTENANKIMKNYLRAYIHFAQDDWVDHLSDAKFAANSHENASTKMISFFADHDFHSRSETKPSDTYDSDRKAESLKANKILERQEVIRKWLHERLTAAQEDQARHANRTRSSHSKYKVKDMIYVNAKNFKSQRQSQSLSSKNAESWKIIRNIDNKAYELEIFEHMNNAKLTPIFHSWKLHFASSNSYLDQVLAPELLILIDENDDSHEEYEILEIVDCRQIRKYGTQYKTTYVDSWDEWNTDSFWQSWTDFSRSEDLILKFHQNNSHKLNSSSELTHLDDPSSTDNNVETREKKKKSSLNSNEPPNATIRRLDWG
jgi:hypothetical protein